VMGLLVVAALANFFAAPGSALMPILVTRHFGGGPTELGWMGSAYGVGFVLGALTLGVWGGFRRRIVTMLTAWLVMALSTLLVALTPATALWLGLVGVFVGGFMNPIANGSAMALNQTVVAPEMQGRALMVTMSVTSAVSPLSMAIAGPIADAWGVRVWYAIGGVGPALLMLAAFFVPAITHLEDNPAPRSAAAKAA
jgi:DHA3 family macrolide efflux protein-like MFS transporter